MTKLRVEVKNLDGKPVDNASVRIQFLEGHSVAKLGRRAKTSWEMKTNQDGVVGMPPIRQGKILVQVMAKGYQTYGDKIEVDEEEKTIEIKLKPPQSQYSEITQDGVVLAHSSKQAAAQTFMHWLRTDRQALDVITAAGYRVRE